MRLFKKNVVTGDIVHWDGHRRGAPVYVTASKHISFVTLLKRPQSNLKVDLVHLAKGFLPSEDARTAPKTLCDAPKTLCDVPKTLQLGAVAGAD